MANPDWDDGRDTVIDRKTDDKKREETKKPRMFKVVMHNDDFTPMDFVVEILVKHFNKGEDDAINIMMAVHKQGKGVAGVYTREIAETKIARSMNDAKEASYPFQLEMEPSE